MELVYLYIRSYKFLQNKEYFFSDRVKYRVEFDKGITRIVESGIERKVPVNFFGNQIPNFSIVVGKNGSGKSTLLDFIKNELVIGNHTDRAAFVAIYLDGNGEYRYKQNACDIECNHEDVSELNLNGEPYLVTYFPIPEFSFKNPYISEEIGSIINLSDNSIIQRDYEMYRVSKQNEIVDRKNMRSDTLSNSLNSLDKGNMFREIQYFLNADFGNIPKANKILIETVSYRNEIEGIKDSTQKRIERLEEDLKNDENDIKLNNIHRDLMETQEYFAYLTAITEILETSISIDDSKERRKLELIRHFTLALFFDGYFKLKEISDKSIPREVLIEEDNKRILSLLENLKKSELKVGDFLSALNDLWSANIGNFGLSETAGKLKFFIEKQLPFAFDNEVGADTHILKTNFQIGYKIFDNTTIVLNFKDNEDETISFLRDLSDINFSFLTYDRSYVSQEYENYHYSTGELQFLKLFSRLYYAFNEANNQSKSNILVTLDEAELGMHPEWQQNMVDWLSEFIQRNVAKYKNMNVQLIMTTHSPLMLSDFPLQNVLRLNGNDGNISTTLPEAEKTFGANLYDLLNDGFILSDGFTGTFARKKIDACFEELIELKKEITPERREEIETVIDLIGEPLLKGELVSLFDKRFGTEKEVSFYDEQIALFEKLRDERMKGKK